MALRARLLVPIATVALVAFAIALAILPSENGYRVRAEFRDAAGLHKHVYVKLGGVPAGTVTSMKLTKRDTALVTMRLDDGAAPVGPGARATVRPVNLLGEKFVDLEPGDASRPLPSAPAGRQMRPGQEGSRAAEPRG